MSASKYILPFFILFVFVYSAFKKVKLYDSFVSGVKQAFPLVCSLFPFLFAILLMAELFEQSGLYLIFIKLITPITNFFGIPKELTRLVLLKPFSGSGSLALLGDIFAEHGADSYLARTAAVIFGSSETVFYVAAVYYSKCKNKKLTLPIIISLVATFISTVFACFICKVM